MRQAPAFTDAQRRHLAEKAKRLGRKALTEIGPLVSPDTLLAWHRKLIARKFTPLHTRGPSRPPIAAEVVELILRMAREKEAWGYTRIQGALSNLGHAVGRGTIANVLKSHGIDPAPLRKKAAAWRTFLKAHWEVLAATDFLTVEVRTPSNLLTYYVLFVVELATRAVHIAGITPHPNEAFMLQIARQLTDPIEGFLLGKRDPILDRDIKFTQAFRSYFEREGINMIRLPLRAPDLNAFAERFVCSKTEELNHRMIFVGEDSLRRAITEFLIHYHTERNHQGLENRPIRPAQTLPCTETAVQCHERLGGQLRYYYIGKPHSLARSSVWTLRVPVKPIYQNILVFLQLITEFQEFEKRLGIASMINQLPTDMKNTRHTLTPPFSTISGKSWCHRTTITLRAAPV